MQLREVNWIGDGALTDIGHASRDVFVRVRSTKPPVAAFLNVEDGETSVAFASSEDGVSPGQACVLYDSDRSDARVLGGGFICATQSATDTRNLRGATLAAAAGG